MIIFIIFKTYLISKCKCDYLCQDGCKSQLLLYCYLIITETPCRINNGCKNEMEFLRLVVFNIEIYAIEDFYLFLIAKSYG